MVTNELGLKLEDAKLKHLGTAKAVIIDANNTLIMGGGGAESDIEERCQQIKDIIANADSSYEKDKAQERLAKLHGGVAQIKVRIILDLNLVFVSVCFLSFFSCAVGFGFGFVGF
jgi:chaperonin GroEL